MDYWRSFGPRSYTVIRTPEIILFGGHLLCIYLFTNLMYTITIFNVLQVSLTDSVQYVLVHISLFFILLLSFTFVVDNECFKVL